MQLMLSTMVLTISTTVAFQLGMRSRLLIKPLSKTILRSSSTQTQDAVDTRFMRLALRHAQDCMKHEEVPVGAVLVDANGTVVSCAGNQVEKMNDASAHAELLCLREASTLRKTWRLTDCTLYCTLEPCIMCMAAINNFRIKRLVFGAEGVRCGSVDNYKSLINENHPFHSVTIVGGVCKSECDQLLKAFFQEQRRKKQDNNIDSHRWLC